ncbi:hypothetical protein N8K70_02610 [Microbacterium betulae]|uniref:Uncharacterized protein n=1 Tax=Microbacterium betulae TaxID=2981139 RepID=A0AA97FID1_9MICO|nr:hypothetical protein [Microbacterium sp. AB]WOF23590.1 hypothetical protein N8K70_02610 [Microbacterium sp. AB]
MTDQNLSTAPAPNAGADAHPDAARYLAATRPSTDDAPDADAPKADRGARKGRRGWKVGGAVAGGVVALGLVFGGGVATGLAIGDTGQGGPGFSTEQGPGDGGFGGGTPPEMPGNGTTPGDSTGTAPDGTAPDGSTSNGSTSDGSTSDGSTSDGSTT